MNNVPKNPMISFILPNYNNEHIIDLFFEKFIENNTYENYEFIVCDDGSLDEGVSKLDKWAQSGKIKNMTVIKEPHKGIVNALNKCLEASKGDFIIRCDGDATIETKSPVEKFLELYSVAPDKIGAITAKITTDYDDILAGSCQICPEGAHDKTQEIAEPVGKRKWSTKYKMRDDAQEIASHPAEVDSCPGCFVFSDKKTALKIGGFDINYPLWFEDIDFYLSHRLHNKKVFYIPDVAVHHRFTLRGTRNNSDFKKGKKFGPFTIKIDQSDQIYYLFDKYPVFKIKTKKGITKYYIYIYIYGIWFLAEFFHKKEYLEKRYNAA